LKGEMELLQNEAADRGHHEGDRQFGEVLLIFRLAPAEEHLFDALGEDEKNGQNRAALHDSQKELGGFVGQPVRGEQHMTGGRNRQEFSDPFDQRENENIEPLRHRVFRKQKGSQDK
jgi:hypothetical protein